MANTSILWEGKNAISVMRGQCENPFFNITGISLDTRHNLQKGDLFFALPSDKCPDNAPDDIESGGHAYVKKAFELGACAAVVSQDIGLDPKTYPLIVVPSTKEALWRLGLAGRNRAPDAQVVGITGSVGKTSTKEAISHILRTHFSVFSSEENFNNQTGIPFCLSKITSPASYCVVEMGVGGPKNMQLYTPLLRLDVALVTAIGEAHREFFSSPEGIAQEKSQIFKGLIPFIGKAVFPYEGPYAEILHQEALDQKVHILRFGTSKKAYAHLLSCFREGEKGYHVKACVGAKNFSYFLSCLGEHWVMNSVAVLAVLAALEVNIEDFLPAFSALSPFRGRGNSYQVVFQDTPFCLIDESYNASPLAVKRALEVLCLRTPSPGGRRIAVLGDMKALGDIGPLAHQNLKNHLDPQLIHHVITCGPLMEGLYGLLPPSQRLAHTTTSKEVIDALKTHIAPHDIVMVKGSRVMALDEVVRFFTKPPSRPHPHP